MRGLADGVEFARVTVLVTTLGAEFLSGASGEFALQGFPDSASEVTLVWQQSGQNFQLRGMDTAGGGSGEEERSYLENPRPGSFQSGIGVLSGWVCEAERVDLEIDGETVQAAYGTEREDTRSVCGDADNGFGLLFNWNRLGDGMHTVRALADGVEFASATFVVTTFGVEMLSGASGSFPLEGFPQLGSTIIVRWQESLQNFFVEGVEGGDPLPFTSGLASGDVTSSSAILWTRVEQAADLIVEVSSDVSFETVAFTQAVSATAENDFTARVTASSLEADQTYFYRWHLGSDTSTIGTFQTAPLSSVSADVRFAFSGDSDGSKVGGGPFFNHFETLGSARLDGLDFFVYLGDTIYADFRAAGLLPDSQNLTEFRQRYKENRAFSALRNLLRATPIYAAWDDHEVRNDFGGPTADPFFFSIGRQSFLEYLPLAEATFPTDPACAAAPMFRVFPWGRDVDVIILDERSCRSASAQAACSALPGSPPDLAPTFPTALRPALGLTEPLPPGCLEAIADPSRSLLGSVQKQLFKAALLDSTAAFKFIINQVPIQQLYAVPYDRWEGYGAERAEILNFIRDNAIDNVIFLTTDMHANLVNQVFIDIITDPEPIADEFVTGPIATATFQDEVREIADELGLDADAALSAFNTALNIVDVDCRQLDAFSYGVVDVDANAGTATITLKDDTGAILRDQLDSATACAKTIGP